MDVETVRLEAIRIAAANCGTNDSHNIVAHAKTFEDYILGGSKKKPGRPAGSKNKAKK